MTDYRLIAADLTRDRGTIIDIWRRNLADVDRLEEKFDWHFLNNPYGMGRSWILEADGQPVGATSLGIRPVKVGNVTIAAGVACDLAVDRKHRLLQPALMLQKTLLAAMKSTVGYIYGVPNRLGDAVLLRAGYREVCEVHRYARVLRLSSYAGRSRYLRPVSRVAGGIADTAYMAISALRERPWSRPNTVILDDFDGRFDELWQRAKSGHAVLTTRDSRFLRWRYRDCPLSRYTIIGLLSSDQARLLGYLIYSVENGHALCADIFAGAAHGEITTLISAWARHARSRGLTSMSISCSGDPILTMALTRAGFRRRSSSPKPGSRRLQGTELSKAILAYPGVSNCLEAPLSEWYYTAGDSPYT